MAEDLVDEGGSEFDAAAEALAAHGIAGPVDHAFVLGTGLGKIAEELEEAVSVAYAEIPGFPKGNVSGHSHRLWKGRMEGRSVLVFQGRAHYYEAGDAAAMRTAVGVLTRLGAPPLILTNAAGSLNHAMKPGALCLISDHINFGARNPLIGDHGDGRFVSMTGAYDSALRRRLKQAAVQAGIALHEGVYMWFSGPSFETPAEIEVARRLGADLVGMSTVPEAILARRFGLRVAAISTITNFGAGMLDSSPSHQETRDVAGAAAFGLRRIIRAFLAGAQDG